MRIGDCQRGPPDIRRTQPVGAPSKSCPFRWSAGVARWLSSIARMYGPFASTSCSLLLSPGYSYPLLVLSSSCRSLLATCAPCRVVSLPSCLCCPIVPTRGQVLRYVDTPWPMSRSQGTLSPARSPLRDLSERCLLIEESPRSRRIWDVLDINPSCA